MELITSNIKSKDHYICDNDDHDDHVGGDYDDMCSVFEYFFSQEKRETGLRFMNRLLKREEEKFAFIHRGRERK